MANAYQGKDTEIGEVIRSMESDYLQGTTQISEHVQFSMHNTLEKIQAYLNSVHISGTHDSLRRKKPFFNIVIALANIWYRATDIDRKHIRIRATKSTDIIGSFLATVHLQDWMRRVNFGALLNEWGRVLSRYGSAAIKSVEKDGVLHLIVVQWARIICDAVDFDANPKIEVLELTPAQLRKRTEYDQSLVEALIASGGATRKTADGQQKDNKSGYIKLYEIHGLFPKSLLTDKEEDKNTYVQQMHVVSYVAGTDEKSGESYCDDYILFRGEEAEDPYMITHLIKEDGRTLSIGAVESVFEAQRMLNTEKKAEQDMLELASKMVFKTTDQNIAGRNVLSNMETGHILFHAANTTLEQLNNQSHDIPMWQNWGSAWKSLANEITGVSEAMLGAAPKSGTAWRQTEALLSESYGLFELMTENKGLALEDMLRQWVIPHLKKKMDTSEEVSATLESHGIDKIDAAYIKSFAVSHTNTQIIEAMKRNERITPAGQELMMAGAEDAIRGSLETMGNQRFFKPSEIATKTWKEEFKDLEWDVEVDITGEQAPIQEILTTLNTAMTMVAGNPMVLEDPRFKLLFNRALEMTGAVSPLELAALPPSRPSMPVAPQGGPVTGSRRELPAENKERNIAK